MSWRCYNINWYLSLYLISFCHLCDAMYKFVYDMVGRVVCWVMPLPMMTWMTLAFILAIHSLHYKWWSSLFEILSHILDCCYRLVYPWTLDFQCGTWQQVVFRSCHIFLWHAPLGVHRAKRRHQSSEWTILSQVNCFIFRDRLFYFRTCWIVFIHVVRGRPGGLLQFSKGGAVKILASVSSGIRTVL